MNITTDRIGAMELKYIQLALTNSNKITYEDFFDEMNVKRLCDIKSGRELFKAAMLCEFGKTYERKNINNFKKRTAKAASSRGRFSKYYERFRMLFM